MRDSRSKIGRPHLCPEERRRIVGSKPGVFRCLLQTIQVYATRELLHLVIDAPVEHKKIQTHEFSLNSDSILARPWREPSSMYL